MSQQTWNADEYKQHASFVPSLAKDLVELLNPQPGETILDLGCGDGLLTLELQQSGCSVIGVDSSPGMVESSKSRGIEAYVQDGHNLNYHHTFDAVFSNAALHWLTQPEKVIEGVHAALKPKGRFVAELGGHGNIAALLKAMAEVFAENKDFGEFIHPWFFPSPKDYQHLLEQQDFEVKTIILTPRPTPLDSGLGKWLEIFADSITRHLQAEQNAIFLSAVKDKLRPILYTEEHGWVADYVRLRFEAVKT